MTCKINCMSHSRDRRMWQVTPEGRVWPCCFWSNAWDKREDPESQFDYELLISDKKLRDIIESDPDWNSLEKHSFDDIISLEYYNKDIYYPGWESDSPHKLCVEECSVVYDEDRGSERSNWDILISSNND